MPISAATHYRVHARDVLIVELEQFAADRESHGKTERAAAARAAAAELAAGADRVLFEDCWRVVGTADRYSLYTGTREEIRSVLDEFGKGALHLGREETAREGARALDALAQGAVRVRAGRSAYVVAEAGIWHGSRAEVLAEIRRAGLARSRARLQQQERELMAAHAAIEGGEDEAVADAVTYVVV